jgi:predicted alpha-1,2-mannosidase
MKQLFTLICWSIGLSAFAQSAFQPEELVNPLMGTDSKRSFSSGNTYPAIAVPWGMNFWTPQTNTNGDGWQYQYSADKIVGFKQTHQPSPWIGDYGQFSILPMTGKMNFKETKRASWFSHKAEIAKPYYYNVYLAEYDVLTEITPTERAAMFRFTFPKTDSAFILVDAFDRGSYLKVIPEANKIIGYTTRSRGGVPTNFKNYFVIECDKAFKLSWTIADSIVTASQNEVSSPHAQAIIGFETRDGEQVHLRVASSFISFEQAELNLSREIGAQTFTQIKTKAKAAWHTELSKIKVEGGTEDQLKTFYSCLYRMLLFPRKFYEFDAQNQLVHYSPYNGKVEKGYMFTDTGFWDTFRSLFPFLTLMYPEMDGHILEGLANTYRESGWLPEWASPGHRKSMIGSNSASVIIDAYRKGVKGYDINVLYEALLKNTEGEGPINTVGRNGAQLYNTLGYVPMDGFGGSAAKTMEYAHADFCLYQLATALKKPQEEIDKFAKRCQNYRNIFDPKHNLMRGRKQDGSFSNTFNPFRWGDEFVEGNSWHYTWSVFHDFKGLSQLMGGHKKMETMLDSVFTLPPIFDGGAYKGGVIHEMVEMQVMNMGQYAHGNQPIQHLIYVYNYCGTPWKTQLHIRDAMNKLYRPTPDGYCGDEDNGQTSAWYVFSAMGFYPVCPGQPEYVIGAPLFKKITLSLENGKKFTIDAPQNNANNLYIQSAILNGVEYDKNYLNHSDISKGGIVQFKMAAQPNLKRGIAPTAAPFSFTK